MSRRRLTKKVKIAQRKSLEGPVPDLHGNRAQRRAWAREHPTQTESYEPPLPAARVRRPRA